MTVLGQVQAKCDCFQSLRNLHFDPEKTGEHLVSFSLEKPQALEANLAFEHLRPLHMSSSLNDNGCFPHTNTMFIDATSQVLMFSRYGLKLNSGWDT